MPKHEWLCKLWNLLGWKGFNRKNNKTWLEIDNSSIVYCLLHFSCKMQNWFWFEKHIDSIAFVGVRWCHIVVGVSSFVNHSYGTLPVSIPLQPVKVSKFYVGCHLNTGGPRIVLFLRTQGTVLLTKPYYSGTDLVLK